MEKKKNPFLIYGYDGPKYFCDREAETDKLISTVENGRNVTLMSPRRMGKTGLILNAFYHIEQRHPDVKCFYMDIFATNSLAEFTHLLGQIVLGNLDNTSERWFNKITDFFKSCRSVISADPVTGAPTVMLNFQPYEAETTLGEIFAYIKESGKECVIAIDEFQQVANYPQKGTEALLRSYIQFMPNTHFIFSGSKRQIMNDMFSLPNRPFYQSTQKMHIEAIDKHVYWEFSTAHLSQIGIELTFDVFAYFYDLLYGHTWYIQRILNKVYEVSIGKVTIDDIDTIIADVLGEEEYNYQRQYSLLTSNQQQLLKAIAMSRTAKSINSKDFIQKYNLGASSSVSRAINYLTNNEFVIDTPDGYQVYDRLFAIWLRRLIC